MTYIERNCKYCGKAYYITEHRLKEIQSNGYDSNYCSKFCLFEDRKLYDMRVCQNCGREFYASNHKNVKYCCNACRTDGFRKKYPVVDADYFEYILEKYNKHINRWIWQYSDLTDRDELYEYAIYAIYIHLAQALGEGYFDIERDKDSAYENIKIRDGLRRATQLFFKEVVGYQRTNFELFQEEEPIFDISDMKGQDDYIREKIDLLHRNLSGTSSGMKYLLKIRFEGKTIEDIMVEEKLPYDIVYNRIYHVKKTMEERKEKGLWID